MFSSFYTIPALILLKNTFSTNANVFPILHYSSSFLVLILFGFLAAHGVAFVIHLSFYFSRGKSKKNKHFFLNFFENMKNKKNYYVVFQLIPDLLLFGLFTSLRDSSTFILAGIFEKYCHFWGLFSQIFYSWELLRKSIFMNRDVISVQWFTCFICCFYCQNLLFNTFIKTKNKIFLAIGVQWNNLFDNNDEPYDVTGSIGMTMIFSLVGIIFNFVMNVYIDAMISGILKVKKHLSHVLGVIFNF